VKLAKQSCEANEKKKSSNSKSTPDYAGRRTLKRSCFVQDFLLSRSTEWNNGTDDKDFYGPYAHIRKTLDYSYHSNYVKTRQWLQDSIVEKLMGELVRTPTCEQYEEMTLTSTLPTALTKNGSGIDVWAMPKEPWYIMIAGKTGTDKEAAIRYLLEQDRLPLLGFVLVDPQEIRMLLPEYSYLTRKDMKLAVELTEKETNYIVQLLSLAALEAGTNVVVYGYFLDLPWYTTYCQRLKRDFMHLKTAILYIVTDEEGGEGANSFADLLHQIDFFCSLRIFSETERNIDIITDGVTWASFRERWKQSSAWVAQKGHQKRSSMPAMSFAANGKTNFSEASLLQKSKSFKSHNMTKASRHHDGECSISQFFIDKSTEEIHASKNMNFFGRFTHIRKSLDYTYHRNYTRERQLLQDAIMSEFMTTPKIVDVDGRVGTTPTEPFVVFTAGAMGAGKGHVLNYMNQNGYFPLQSFVIVDPDEIRSQFPEYSLYKSENPLKAGELTRKEAGYMVEILSYAAMQAGKNVLIDGSLRDWEWYREYFIRLRKEFSCAKISILHIDAPREEIIKRAKLRGIITGRKIPQETLETAIKQVPLSVARLKDHVDFYYKLDNSPGSKDVELLAEECSWEKFRQSWVQECAWVTNGKQENLLPERQFRTD